MFLSRHYKYAIINTVDESIELLPLILQCLSVFSMVKLGFSKFILYNALELQNSLLVHSSIFLTKSYFAIFFGTTKKIMLWKITLWKFTLVEVLLYLLAPVIHIWKLASGDDIFSWDFLTLLLILTYLGPDHVQVNCSWKRIGDWKWIVGKNLDWPANS